MSQSTSRAAAGPLAILAAAVLWGSTGTVSSFAPASAPAIAVGASGLTFGGLLLFVTSRGIRTLFRRSDRAQRWLLLAGVVAVAGYPLTFYPAVHRAGVAVTTVIALGSAPVFAGLLSWLAGQGRPTRRWAVATGVAVLGCAVLVVGEHTGQAHADLVGLGLAALAGLSYAGYSVVGGQVIARGHPSGAVLGTMFGGAAVLVVPVLLAAGPAWLGSVRGLAVALHLALFTTFLAYLLFGRGLRSTPASVATTLTLAEPAVAAVLGVLVRHERLSALSWCGLAVLALALALLSLPNRPGRARGYVAGTDLCGEDRGGTRGELGGEPLLRG